MKRLLLLCFLLSVFASQAVAQKSKPVGYFIQSHTNPDARSIHIRATLTESGIVHGYFFLGDGLADDFTTDGFAPILRDLAKVRGIEEMYLERYELSLFKKRRASWRRIMPRVKKIIGAYLKRSLVPMAPEPSLGEPVLPVLPAIVVDVPENGHLRYLKNQCQVALLPNPEALQLTFEYPIAVDSMEYDSIDPMHTIGGTDLFRDLMGLEGIQDGYFEGCVAHLYRGAAFRWADIFPKIQELIAKHSEGYVTRYITAPVRPESSYYYERQPDGTYRSITAADLAPSFLFVYELESKKIEKGPKKKRRIRWVDWRQFYSLLFELSTWDDSDSPRNILK